MKKSDCPSSQELRDYLNDELSVAEMDDIAVHVQQCPDCQTIIHRLEDEITKQSSPITRREETNPNDGDERGDKDVSEEKTNIDTIEGFNKPDSFVHRLEEGEVDSNQQEPVPERIGSYLLKRVLGRGGMGTVYLATHQHLGSDCALKVVSSRNQREVELIKRFQREMKSSGRLAHDNIIRPTDAGIADGFHFLAMEYIDGPNISELVKAIGPLSIADACEIIRQSCIGLQHANEKGLIHRDIKPSNLMLNSDGIVKVADFGLARPVGDLATEETELTSSGQVMGTVDFMAPEQAQGQSGIDVRADLYSLGATLFMLLTGKPPFHGVEYQNQIQKILGHVRDNAPSVLKFRDDIPKKLNRLIGVLLSKKPDDRPSAPSQVAIALGTFCVGSDLRALISEYQAPPKASEIRDEAKHSTHSQLSAEHETLSQTPRDGDNQVEDELSETSVQRKALGTDTARPGPKITTVSKSVVATDEGNKRNWLGLVIKGTLFAVPVIALTVLLILVLLPTGQTLPVLTLDFTQNQDPRGQKKTWERINYRFNKNTEIELPTNLRFGGPNNDAVFVFNDLLGSAKPVGERGALVACVFEPSTEEEHLIHAFRGLRSDETTAERNQWVPFEDYVQKTVEAISEVAKLKTGERGKIVLVLDIDHPDLPARLPPQANPFVRLCKLQWNTASDKLNQTHDVHVWLSHSEGQKSYYDSDFLQVESFFKKRFDQAITGDVLNLKSRKSQRDIYYSDLKQYMKKWVESDSNIHNLAQTPKFLEPDGDINDFQILRFVQDPSPATELFDYASRKTNGNIEELWGEFEEAKKSNQWDLENPLLVQRSTMLLLQLEKLWYTGKDRSDLFRDLSDELRAHVKTTTTIDPIQHTLHDAQARSPKTTIQPLNLDLLSQIPLAADADKAETDQPPSQETLDQLIQEREAALSNWRNNFPDWTGAMGAWQTFRDNQASQSEMAFALDQLTDGQKLVKRTKDAGDLESIPWNEIAYLDRLAHELAWPTNKNDLANFKELVQLSIRVRDQANRFQSQLIPALCLQFNDRFEKLESRRRFDEDRLYANDHAGLRDEFDNLAVEYETLYLEHDDLKDEFELIQQELVSAPHDLRYCLESLAVQALGVQARDGGSETDRKSVIQQFENWTTRDDGFIAAWKGLGFQTIDSMQMETGANRRTSTFREIRRDGIPNRGIGTEDSKVFASNPYIDFADYTSSKVNLRAVEGNLLARRLLFWPGLDSEIRKKIREDLCNESVDKSGNTVEESDTSPEAEAETEGQTKNFDIPEISRRLTDVFEMEPMQILPRSDEPIPFALGDENIFIRVAFGAHRLLIQRDDQTAENLVLAINDFRSKKSNLDFQRFASDLWATPRSSLGKPFAVAALNNHQNVVETRIQQMPGLEPIKDKLSKIWNSGPKKNWPIRTKEVETFCASFDKGHWQWLKESQKAVNNRIADGIENEKRHDNELLFRLSPRDFEYDTILKGKFVNENNWLDHDAIFSGDSLRVYLRGHDATFAMGHRQPESYEVKLNTNNPVGAQLIVKRVNGESVNGRVTVVIDCSRSMRSVGMRRAKEDVVQFLEQVSDRGDISVSLVAIGASEFWNWKKKKWEVRDMAELPSWQKDDKYDVWLFEGTGKGVDKESLPSLKKAISELREYGETPILAGLDKALDLTKGISNQANLVVLLTDGFEFGSNRDTNAKEAYAPFDVELFSRVSEQLNAGTELIVFSFLTRKVSDSFREMIDAGCSESEIRRRIGKINSLATIHKTASEISLRKFLEDLLRKQEIVVMGYGEPPLSKTQRVEVGMDLNYDGTFSDEERRIMAAIELGANQRPKSWSMGVQFTTEGDAARPFAEQPSAWNSDVRIAGNEFLEFAYDPVRPSFQLTTASISDRKELQLSKHKLLVGKTSNRLQKSEFEIASQDKEKLTPAPAITFLTLDQNKNPRQTVLIQDFSLGQQLRSNVHPVEFAEFKDLHRQAMFSRNRVDVQLHFLKEFTPQFWTRIQFSAQDPWTVTNEGEKELNLKTSDYVSLAKVLPKTPGFDDYVIEIRRDDTNPNSDYVDFWIRIKPKDLSKPIDRWLVQILGKDGQIDRTTNLQSERRYVFRESNDATRQLRYIEHHFTIIKHELQKSIAYFGFANIDHLTDIEIGKVDYPDYFKE